MFRTLLVDDDFLVRSYLKSLTAWTRAGYEVTADVQDAEEALWTLEREDIDVMITDISMPLMDGIELIRQIRCDNNKLYIIVLSCHDDFDYVKEAMRQGADEYVLKNSLNEETLYDILMKTKKHIAFRKEKSTQQKEVDKLLEIRNHALKYHFFNGILSGTLSGSKREEKRLEASILGKL
ncbi:MAG: response regulator [Clostridia bacterium]|nr:response regulator [Clostridia bacterium]